MVDVRMKTKRQKFLLTAIVAPALIFFAGHTVYAAGADLACDGSNFDLTAKEGDSVSFSSSAGANSVSLDGQIISVPGSSGPLSAGVYSFSDDCASNPDSGSITVSAASVPPPAAGGSTTGTPPSSSIAKPNSSAPAKPGDTPPSADTTSTLSASTDQPDHSGKGTSVLGASSASKKSGSGKVTVGLFEKVMIAAAALILLASVIYGLYRLIKRPTGRKTTALRRSHAQPELQMPVFQVPVAYEEPEIYKQPVYRYQSPANTIGGPSAIGG
jgi:hypothetical protein